MTASPANAPVRQTWCWRRWIVAGQQELWTDRLQPVPDIFWVIIEKPQRTRLLVEAHAEKKSSLIGLQRDFGGNITAIAAKSWMESNAVPPTKIGADLQIIHDEAPDSPAPAVPHLRIPHGLAFGSGDHGTTYMLLRALVLRKNWSGVTVLDLGTGSGVLALAARLLGATKIAATDFDPESVRTSKQNELLNFPTPSIRWSRSDVKTLRGTKKYGLVLANLFSGILCEAAQQIVSSVAESGELWLSGILRTQQEEVASAYLRQGLTLAKVNQRGKWVMLEWKRD